MQKRCRLRSVGRSISEFKCRAGRRSRAVGGGQGNDSVDGQGKAIEPHGLPSPSSSWRPPLPINRARTQSAPFIGAHRPPATGPPALQALAFGSQSPVSCLFPSSCGFFPFSFTLGSGGDKTVASLPPSPPQASRAAASGGATALPCSASPLDPLPCPC